ncbi:hypothetical protein THAOC_10741, partial [Thalassiosira oceanica]
MTQEIVPHRYRYRDKARPGRRRTRAEGQGRAVVGDRGDAHPRPPPSGPSASGSSPSSTPTTTPDRAAKHAHPLVDARPGAEARRHDRALVDAGRTELVVWGIGSSIMVDHDN